MGKAVDMKNVSNYGDSRSTGFCVHCGSSEPDTRDHAPSKVFLDSPLPANLPLSPSCKQCNNGFSSDELYLACLLECITTGDVNINHFEREKIKTAVSKDRKILEELKRARTVVNNQILWKYEEQRIEKVIVKLARCHAAFELNEPQIDCPSHISISPIILMTDDAYRDFIASSGVFAGWPEVGSRAMTRLVASDTDIDQRGWITVQKDRYMYKVGWENGVNVKIIIRDYLAVEVVWE